LLASGFSFTSLSYLWSPEFLVSLFSNKNRTLCALVLLAAILATFAGPATAVLVIPSTIKFAAGETHYFIFINATKDVLWPDKITMDHFLPDYTNVFNESVKCNSATGYKNALCPSGGFQSLLEHFSANTLRTRAGIPVLNPDSTKIFAHTVRGGIIVQSPHGQFAAQTIAGQLRGEDITETFASATHGATTSLQMPLNQDWVLAAENAKNMYANSRQISRLRFYAIQESTVLSQVPAVRVVCLGQQIAAGSSSITFPAIPEYDLAIDSNGTVLHGHTVAVEGIPDQKIVDFHTWAEPRNSIPANESVSQDFVFSAPRQGNNSQAVTACSIDARWAEAIVWTRFLGPVQASFLHTRPATHGFRETSFLPTDGGSWRRIQFDPSWISSVDFLMTDPSVNTTWQNRTSLSTLITASGIVDKLASLDPTAVAYLEYILTTVFADALSRTSSHLSYTSDPDTHIADWPLLNYNSTPTTPGILSWSRAITPADASQNPSKYTKMHMQQTVTGFGCKASGPSDYLCILILLVHLILASGHTIYVLGFSHRTSGCWDTFSELVALAQQSIPAKRVLRNTCAGIERSRVYSKPVRIRVSNLEEDHLELDFDGELDFKGVDSEDEIDYGTKYG
jgi:hypothetical protein